VKRRGLVGERRSKEDLAAPEWCSRKLPHCTGCLAERALGYRVRGHRHNRKVIGHERMSGVDVARGNDDRAPLRAYVIEDPGECPRNEGNRDERALADQFSRAGERTIRVILASAVRRPVSGRSTSIRNTRS